MRFEIFCKCGIYLLSDVPLSIVDYYEIECSNCSKVHRGRSDFVTSFSLKLFWHRLKFKIGQMEVRFRIKFGLYPEEWKEHAA